MIRIARAAEPSELPAVRAHHLALARAAGTTGERVTFREYDIVKPQLAEMQHIKCCYCEKREEQAKYRDVEHYRPKATYWWLAWTWENLLFSCIDCNREHKRDQFPLAPGSAALVAEQSPPGSENALVLDPSDAAADPTTHIEFRCDKVQGKERWAPYGLTDQGRRTIEVCGLDRPGLLDLYKRHVIDVVRPKLEHFRAALRTNQAQEIVRAWETTRRGLLGREQQFRALSFDALRVLVPSDVRERHRLELPRP